MSFSIKLLLISIPALFSAVLVSAYNYFAFFENVSDSGMNFFLGFLFLATLALSWSGVVWVYKSTTVHQAIKRTALTTFCPPLLFSGILFIIYNFLSYAAYGG